MNIYQALRELEGYRPKTEGFTSVEEMQMIKETLKLDTASRDDLENIRNMCVLMWSGMIRKYNDDGLMDAMMSITAVIDDYRYLKE